MKDRLKKIRNESPYGKSQSSFAEFLGIPQANLASYETGRRTPTDAVIQLICQKWNVNQDWLRTGNGEMFVELSKDEQISAMLGEIQRSGDENFKYRLVSALCKLSESDWTALENLVDMISDKK